MVYFDFKSVTCYSCFHFSKEQQQDKADELKQRLIVVLNGLHQNIVVTAVSEWRKHVRDCVRTFCGN